jgi:K+-transporting ATPase ATPase C chain
MLGHLRGNLWLLVLSLLLCCVLYPLAVLGIARVCFSTEAEGSLIDAKGHTVTDPAKAVGSRLIAQPFTADEYFQPRPSAVSFNASASGASNWGANNYLLRDRVARQLGPIVKYQGGAKKGQLVGPDVEDWFGKDQFAGNKGIVAQWAQAHTTLAANWVKADKKNGAYVEDWMKAHPAEVAAWKKDNPDNPEPKPEDLAVPFFTSYAKDHAGTFPGAVEHKTADDKTEKAIEPVKEGTDIQSIFFDMWRQEHPDADLENVPADMVMASGSGLDPDITLKNALYQLDRVAAAWAGKSHGDEAKIRKSIERILHEKATAPLAGLAGVELVNVLEVNLALTDQITTKAASGALAPDPAEVKSAPAADLGAIHTRMGEIAGEMDKLGTRLEAIAHRDDGAAATRAGIKSIEDRLDKLTEATRGFPQLSQRLGHLEQRLDAADQSVKQLGTRVEKANEALKALPKPAASVTTSAPR